MAKSRSPLRAEGKELTLVTFSFAPNNTSAPTDLRGAVVSVTRNSAGNFTAVLPEIYTEFVSGSGTVQLAAAADMGVQLGTFTAATPSIVVRTVAGASETDIAPDANNRVHVQLWFRRSSVKN